MNVNWVIEAHERVTSTQDLLKELAQAGKPEGAVVQAAEQTGGYGRQGRAWVSEPGNLYVSVLLRPKCDVQLIGQLSLMAGLAVARTVREVIDEPDSVLLKWPNDILIDGKKCAGLILETGLGEGQTLEWIALGIGINLVSAPEGVGVSINDKSEKRLNINKLQDKLLNQLKENYEQWHAQGFAPLKREWLALAHKKGDAVSVKIGGEVRQGVFHDIDDQGALLLHDEELRVQKITSGDIFL